MTHNKEQLTTEAINLLKQLIQTESFSRNEGNVSDWMEAYLCSKDQVVERFNNNIWTWATPPDPAKPTILLNSHLDTVRPSDKWQYDPFVALEEDGRLIGLGSNDAGGPLVALMATFFLLKEKEQPYNLVFAATAEEEISGTNGVASILDRLGQIDLAIVGEPTRMQMAVAEKGLMVLDCVAHGKTGHAARDEGLNAIYEALDDIQWFKTFSFPKISSHLGPVKMTVTQVDAGSQHNVVPDTCHFVVDVRLNECYSNEECFDTIRQHVKCDVKPRSFRLNSSSIGIDHPVVKRGLEHGISYYGSPTTSDQAVMNFTTLKMGPGDSARSHTPDEFIYLSEIEEGVSTYFEMLDGLVI